MSNISVLSNIVKVRPNLGLRGVLLPSLFAAVPLWMSREQQVWARAWKYKYTRTQCTEVQLHRLTQTESSALPGTHINPSSTHKDTNNTAKSCFFSSAYQDKSSSVSTPPTSKTLKIHWHMHFCRPSNPGESVSITSAQSPCPCPELCLSSLQSWPWLFPDSCL